MSWIADIVARGVTPRQHHDATYNENIRIVSYSCRVAPSSEIAEDWDHEPGTVGDDLGHALWRERKGQRKMPGWSSAWPVVVSGASGSLGGGTGVRPRWFVYPDRGNSVPDTRFVAKEPASFSGGYPSWATRFPSGWTATLNAGTTEQEQKDIFHPDFLGLVAGNRGVTGYSTRVLDMQSGQIDASMAADLSTVFSVEDIIASTTPYLQTGKVVATQLGQTGQGDNNSAGMMNLGWNNGGGKNLLCLSGTVGGPFITPASAAVQVGAARGNVPIYPACMSTDTLHRVPGTGLLGPLEFHGFDPKPLQPDLPWGLVQSRILWKPRPISPAAYLSTNLNTPGSWQIWTAVPYIDRPRPTTGTAPRPGFGNVPLIGTGPTGSGPRQSFGGTAGLGPGGNPPGGLGGRIQGPGAALILANIPAGAPRGQRVIPSGGVRVNRRSPLSGFGIPNSGGPAGPGGGGGNGPSRHTDNGRDRADNSAGAKARRLEDKLRKGREKRAEKRADREAKRADRRARNPRGRKAREAREARRRAKAKRKQDRKDRKDAKDKAKKDKKAEKDAEKQARKDRRREKEEARHKKALERDRIRRRSLRRSGGTEGIPLFPRHGSGGYDPAPSQVYPATVGSLGGFEFIAGAYARGTEDLAGTAAGDMDQALVGLLMGAPCVGRLTGYAKNPTGGWGSFDYVDRERAISAGGSIALLPAGYDLEADFRGDEQPLEDSSIGTASLMAPSDLAQLAFGIMDPATGGFHSGVSMGTTSLLDQFAIRNFDGNAAFTGNEYLIGETGHVFNGSKVTMNTRLDPWTCEFTDRVGINDIPSGNQGFRFDSLVNTTHPLFTHSSGPQVTDVVAFLSDITAGGGTGVFQLLSKTTGVDLLSVANNPLFVVPAGEEAIATRVVIVPTTITGAITAAPRVGVGTNAGADDIIAGATRLPNLTVGKAYSFTVPGETEMGLATETISFGVDTAAGGATTLTATVYLFGFFSSLAAGAGGAAGSTGAGIEILDAQIAPVGNVGAGSDVLKTFTIPAGKLANDGDSVRVRAWGTVSGGSDDALINIQLGAFVVGVINELNAAAQAWEIDLIVSRETAGQFEATAVQSKNGQLPDVNGNSGAITFASAIVLQCLGENLTDADSNRAVCVGWLVEYLDTTNSVGAIAGSGGGQRVNSITTNPTARVSCGVIPYDDTIPLVGEGAQLAALAYTASDITNVLEIHATVNGAISAGGIPILTLFRDGVIRAVATGTIGGTVGQCVLIYRVFPSDLASHTWALRAGSSTGTWEVNSDGAGARIFGSTSIQFSTFIIKEFSQT